MPGRIYPTSAPRDDPAKSEAVPELARLLRWRNEIDAEIASVLGRSRSVTRTSSRTTT